MTNTSHQFYQGRVYNGPHKGELRLSNYPILNLPEPIPPPEFIDQNGIEPADAIKHVYQYKWDNNLKGWVLV